MSAQAAGDSGTSKVAVVVRVRGLNTAELGRGSADCFIVDAAQNAVMPQPGLKDGRGRDGAPKTAFAYSKVFDASAGQSDVYDFFQPMVDRFTAGYNACIMAYGQTGSGKTYTMGSAAGQTDDNLGVIPRIVEDVLKAISTSAGSAASGRGGACDDDTVMEPSTSAAASASCGGALRPGCRLTMTFVEIYNEVVKDLLLPEGVPPHPKGCPLVKDAYGNYQPTNATEVEITSADSFYDCLALGTNNRATASTNMNSVSSRSHAVITLRLEQPGTGAEGGAGAAAEEGAAAVADGSAAADSASSGSRVSVFRLVDLAGSERVSQTGAEGQRLKEASKINLSLSTLGQCIVALAQAAKTGNKKPHVPFRNSKLTQLLSNSLGGNCATALVACVSPADDNFEQSLNTLHYAAHAAQIENRPVLNVDPLASCNLALRTDLQVAVGELTRLYAAGVDLAPEVLLRFGIGDAAAAAPVAAPVAPAPRPAAARGRTATSAGPPLVRAASQPAMAGAGVDAGSSARIAELQARLEETRRDLAGIVSLRQTLAAKEAALVAERSRAASLAATQSGLLEALTSWRKDRDLWAATAAGMVASTRQTAGAAAAAPLAAAFQAAIDRTTTEPALGPPALRDLRATLEAGGVSAGALAVVDEALATRLGANKAAAGAGAEVSEGKEAEDDYEGAAAESKCDAPLPSSQLAPELVAVVADMACAIAEFTYHFKRLGSAATAAAPVVATTDALALVKAAVVGAGATASAAASAPLASLPSFSAAAGAAMSDDPATAELFPSLDEIEEALSAHGAIESQLLAEQNRLQAEIQGHDDNASRILSMLRTTAPTLAAPAASAAPASKATTTTASGAACVPDWDAAERAQFERIASAADAEERGVMVDALAENIGSEIETVVRQLNALDGALDELKREQEAVEAAAAAAAAASSGCSGAMVDDEEEEDEDEVMAGSSAAGGVARSGAAGWGGAGRRGSIDAAARGGSTAASAPGSKAAARATAEYSRKIAEMKERIRALESERAQLKARLSPLQVKATQLAALQTELTKVRDLKRKSEAQLSDVRGQLHTERQAKAALASAMARAKASHDKALREKDVELAALRSQKAQAERKAKAAETRVKALEVRRATASAVRDFAAGEEASGAGAVPVSLADLTRQAAAVVAERLEAAEAAASVAVAGSAEAGAGALSGPPPLEDLDGASAGGLSVASLPDVPFSEADVLGGASSIPVPPSRRGAPPVLNRRQVAAARRCTALLVRAVYLLAASRHLSATRLRLEQERAVAKATLDAAKTAAPAPDRAELTRLDRAVVGATVRLREVNSQSLAVAEALETEGLDDGRWVRRLLNCTLPVVVPAYLRRAWAALDDATHDGRNSLTERSSFVPAKSDLPPPAALLGWALPLLAAHVGAAPAAGGALPAAVKAEAVSAVAEALVLGGTPPVVTATAVAASSASSAARAEPESEDDAMTGSSGSVAEHKAGDEDEGEDAENEDDEDEAEGVSDYRSISTRIAEAAAARQPVTASGSSSDLAAHIDFHLDLTGLEVPMAPGAVAAVPGAAARAVAASESKEGAGEDEDAEDDDGFVPAADPAAVLKAAGVATAGGRGVSTGGGVKGMGGPRPSLPQLSAAGGGGVAGGRASIGGRALATATSAASGRTSVFLKNGNYNLADPAKRLAHAPSLYHEEMYMGSNVPRFHGPEKHGQAAERRRELLAAASGGNLLAPVAGAAGAAVVAPGGAVTAASTAPAPGASAALTAAAVLATQGPAKVTVSLGGSGAVPAIARLRPGAATAAAKASAPTALASKPATTAATAPIPVRAIDPFADAGEEEEEDGDWVMGPPATAAPAAAPAPAAKGRSSASTSLSAAYLAARAAAAPSEPTDSFDLLLPATHSPKKRPRLSHASEASVATDVGLVTRDDDLLPGVRPVNLVAPRAAASASVPAAAADDDADLYCGGPSVGPSAAPLGAAGRRASYTLADDRAAAAVASLASEALAPGSGSAASANGEDILPLASGSAGVRVATAPLGPTRRASVSNAAGEGSGVVASKAANALASAALLAPTSPRTAGIKRVRDEL